MFPIALFVVGFLHSTSSGTAAAEKPYSLTMLAQIPFYEVKAGDAKICRIAMQLAADAVNNRQDMLTDYHVELDFQDEDRNDAVMSVRQLFAFKRRFELGNGIINGSYQSPVTIAPRGSTGCKGFATVIDNVEMVGITYGCSSDFFTANRAVYPNLYRTRLPAELIGFSFFGIMKTLRWKKIGIVSTTSTLDFSLVKAFYSQALETSNKVVWVDIFQTFSLDALQPLKNSDARVIAAFINGADNIVMFLCLAYRLGLTGSRYTFLALVSAFNDPTKLPDIVAPGCQKPILVEQMKYTLWLGGLAFGVEHNHTSSLGHNLVSLNEAIANRTQGALYADFHRRHQCYDAMTQAILTLDLTEKQLKQRNMTLKNYKDQPKSVIEIANASAGRIEYTSLRIGPIAYSKRLEMDNEPQFAAAWSPESSLQLFYEIRCKVGGSVLNGNDYVVTKIRDIKWFTGNGLPPNDTVPRHQIIDDVPPQSYIVTYTFVLLASIAQIGLLIPNVYKSRKGVSVDGWLAMKVAVFCGCILLNAAAVCFAIERGPNSTVACYLAHALGSIGLAIIHGALFAQLRLVRTMCLSIKRNNVRSSKQSPTLQNMISQLKSSGNTIYGRTTPTAQVTTETMTRFFVDNNLSMVKINFATILLWSMPVVALLIVWFVIDPLASILVKVTPQPVYDNMLDAYFTGLVSTCFSKNTTIWLLVLAAFIILPLGVSLFMIYSLHRRFQTAKTLDAFKWTSVAVINAATIFCGSLLIIATLNSTTTRYMVVSYILIAHSVLTSAIIFVPGWKSDYQNIFRHASSGSSPCV